MVVDLIRMQWKTSTLVNKDESSHGPWAYPQPIAKDQLLVIGMMVGKWLILHECQISTLTKKLSNNYGVKPTTMLDNGSYCYSYFVIVLTCWSLNKGSWWLRKDDGPNHNSSAWVKSSHVVSWWLSWNHLNHASALPCIKNGTNVRLCLNGTWVSSK